MTPALNANCPIAQHNGESMSADLGTWLLDHQFVLLSLIAALGGVGRLLLGVPSETRRFIWRKKPSCKSYAF